MDPAAHTLVGFALAQAGIGGRTRYATAALVIGANLPDIDALSMFGSPDFSLGCRRGWTHGILAMVVLPALLAAALILVDRIRGGGSGRGGSGVLLRLSYLAFLTHPALDWLNNYGVRLLMPFEGRWFYGDAVFIMDPWIWLMLGGAVFLAHSRHITSLLAWLMGMGLAGALLWRAAPDDLLAAKIGWTAALGVLLLLRLRRSFFAERAAVRLAVIALIVTALYIGAMIGAARYSRRWVLDEMARRGERVDRLMVGPQPVTPFVKDVIVQTPRGYRYGRLHLLPAPQLDLASEVLPLPQGSVREALASPAVRGFSNWARFPFGAVNGDRVVLMDARFSRRPVAGFATFTVPRQE